MYTKAATAGFSKSMYRLGMAELHGELGFSPNVINAVKWFKRGASGI
jgi:TPR repeat protein